MQIHIRTLSTTIKYLQLNKTPSQNKLIFINSIHTDLYHLWIVLFSVQISIFSILLLLAKLRSPLSHRPQALQLLRAHWVFWFAMRIYHINVTRWCCLHSLTLAVLNCTCFLSGGGFSLSILSLTYATETAQGKIWHKVRMQKTIREDILSRASQNVLALKSELGFWICQIGNLHLSDATLVWSWTVMCDKWDNIGDSLIKGCLWRSFWNGRKD